MSQHIDDLSRMLTLLDRRHEQLADGTILVALKGSPTPVALRLASPVLVARVIIGRLPAKDATPLLRRLLELNATELLHAAFGLDDDTIVLSAALESVNLDVNELMALLDDLDFALAAQVPRLRELAGGRPFPRPRRVEPEAPPAPKAESRTGSKARTASKARTPAPAPTRAVPRSRAAAPAPSAKRASKNPAAVSPSRAKRSVKAPTPTTRKPTTRARGQAAKKR